MVKCLISTFNPVLRVPACYDCPAVVCGSMKEPLIQHGIRKQSVNHLPQNGIVYGFAIYSRYGARLTNILPVLREYRQIWSLYNYCCPSSIIWYFTSFMFNELPEVLLLAVGFALSTVPFPYPVSLCPEILPDRGIYWV